MSLSLCPSAASGHGRRPLAVDRSQLRMVAGAFTASAPVGLLGYLLVEDARIATVFALLVAITLLSLFTEPVGRRH